MVIFSLLHLGLGLALARVRVNSFKLSENMLVAAVSISIAVIYLIVGNFIPTVDNRNRTEQTSDLSRLQNVRLESIH